MGGGDLRGHVMRIGQLLVIQVAALLWQDLVLDVHRRRAGVLEAPHHRHDVERLAIAGVAVHQHRQRGRARDLADEKTDFVHGNHAEVRQAHAGGHGCAGQVRGLEARRAGLQRGHAVMGSGDLQDAGPVQQGAETLPGRGVGKVGGNQVGHQKSSEPKGCHVFISKAARRQGGSVARRTP